jgi:hypothetical protein
MYYIYIYIYTGVDLLKYLFKATLAPFAGGSFSIGGASTACPPCLSVAVCPCVLAWDAHPWLGMGALCACMRPSCVWGCSRELWCAVSARLLV